jgi:hypothetical protein
MLPALNKPLGYIDQFTFPLKKLHSALRDVSRELHLGHGFKVVKGVPSTDILGRTTSSSTLGSLLILRH